MEKKQVAEILDEMGTLLELQGANPFKSRAFHNASIIIGSLTEDLDSLVASDQLIEIDGIGKGLASIITDLVNKGVSKEHQDLKASFPPGVPGMLRISGLGPKRVKMLYEKLKISSVENLKEACLEHRLAAIKGFGEKTEANILKGIDRLQRTSGTYLYPRAREAAEKLIGALSSLTQLKRYEVAGSLRRRKEVIGDIDLVVSAEDHDRKSIIDAFVKHPDVERVIAVGETKSSATLKAGMNCDLRVVKDIEYPFALNYFTGSKEHNIEMRSLARKKGWSLNEYGFTWIDEGKEGEKGKTLPNCKDEEDIYGALGLGYIAPEMRENTGEFGAASAGTLPNLVEEKDLKGTFHCHSKYSDGANTLEELARAAQAMGWEYVGIADHSKAAIYAKGMSSKKTKDQMRAIDKLNGKLKGFRVFKGIECDILTDGSLDFPDRVLGWFDHVIASIHSGFKMTEAQATKRVIKALKNKNTTILGHPTGRLLMTREGYPINMIEVINAASDYGKAIEINSHPLRLDLDWRLVKYAKEKKVPIAINPDAHNVEGLRDVRFGVGIARKGWLQKEEVLNAWNTDDVERFFANLRQQ